MQCDLQLLRKKSLATDLSKRTCLDVALGPDLNQLDNVPPVLKFTFDPRALPHREFATARAQANFC